MQTDETGKIAFLVALNKVQGLLEPAKKDSDNPFFKSRYASLGAVNAAVMGPITEAGFVLLSGGVDISGKPHLRTTLYHVGGYSVSFEYPLLEKTDDPQKLASSFTYARRYSVCALFNLSVEDDDGNAAAGKTSAPAAVATTTPRPAIQAQKTDGKTLVSKAFVPQKLSEKDGKYNGKTWHSTSVCDPDGAWYCVFNNGNENEADMERLLREAKTNETEIVLDFVVGPKGNKIVKVEVPQEVPF